MAFPMAFGAGGGVTPAATAELVALAEAVGREPDVALPEELVARDLLRARSKKPSAGS